MSELPEEQVVMGLKAVYKIPKYSIDKTNVYLTCFSVLSCVVWDPLTAKLAIIGSSQCSEDSSAASQE